MKYHPTGTSKFTLDSAYEHDCWRSHKQGLNAQEKLKRPKRNYSHSTRKGIDGPRLSIIGIVKELEEKPACFASLVSLKHHFNFR